MYNQQRDSSKQNQNGKLENKSQMIKADEKSCGPDLTYISR